MPSWNDLIYDCLYDMGAYSPGETVNAADLTYCQRKLNQIIQGMQGKRRFAFGHGPAQYTVTSAHSPHLIGPGVSSPDWTAARPSEIEKAEYITGTTYTPIKIIDMDEWHEIPSKEQTGTIPLKLLPNFKQSYVAIYLWPIPSTGYNIQLYTWDCIPQVDGTTIAWTDDYAMPPEYDNYLQAELKIKTHGRFAKQLDPEWSDSREDAKYEIARLNIKSPRLYPLESGVGVVDDDYRIVVR